MYELKQTCPSEPTPGTCAIPEYIPVRSHVHAEHYYTRYHKREHAEADCQGVPILSSVPAPTDICVILCMQAAHATQHAPWLGGAVLGRVLAGQGHWVTRWDYDEVGPAIVGRKCG